MKNDSPNSKPSSVARSILRIGSTVAGVVVAGYLSLCVIMIIQERGYAQRSKRWQCIGNLRELEAGKMLWADYNNKVGDTNALSADELKPYLTSRVFPTCPLGGIYSIQSLKEKPTCSIPNHK